MRFTTRVTHGLFLKTWFCGLPAGRNLATKSTKDTKESGFFPIYVPFVANMNGLHRSCPCPNPLPTNTSPLLAYTKAASAVTKSPCYSQPALGGASGKDHAGPPSFSFTDSRKLLPSRYYKNASGDVGGVGWRGG